MKELKLQVLQIYNILEKIDIKISNSILSNTEINIQKQATDNANIILENAVIARDIVNIAAINASIIIKSTADTTADEFIIQKQATDIDNANIILENAVTALDIVNIAAIKASNIVRSTSFDNNMYIKCLIHEIKTPITNISLGINSIENNIIENKNNNINNEILNTIHGLNKSLEYLDDVLTKFCVIKNGKMVLNDFEPFSIKILFDDIEKILQYNIE